jgi:hypothetical protein
MPTRNTNTGGPIDSTNKKQKREIDDDIIDEIRDISSVRRERNSLFTSSNFHLDARSVDDGYKVEIQHKRGSKRTVSCVVLEDTCNSLADLQAALRGSMGSQTVWHAT